MATPSLQLIRALREAADRIETSTHYQWGHMGSCNCGHLAQVITKLSKAEIHAYAMRKYGDWSEQVADYCPNSGLPFDLLISEMLNFGITREDLIALEKLSDKEILKSLPLNKNHLEHNKKEDVVLYINIWADMLQEQLSLKYTFKAEEIFKEELIEF